MRRDVPVWLLGLTNLPLGVTGAVALLIAPQVLAARHVPETTIASVTALGLAGTFCFFLVAPILDVQFSRRTYAMATSVVSAVVTFGAVMSFSSVGLLGVWLFLALLAANLNQAAIGGWFGSVQYLFRRGSDLLRLREISGRTLGSDMAPVFQFESTGRSSPDSTITGRS